LKIKNPRFPLYIGLGTWRNSEVPLKLLDLEKFLAFPKVQALRKFRALLLPETQAAGEARCEVKT